MPMTMINATRINGTTTHHATHPARYRRYPAYRDSGVEWLGEIPAHWEVKRLKYLAQSNPSPKSKGTWPIDMEVSFVPMEAIGEYGGIELSRTKLLSEIGSGYTFFQDGDVVIAKITPCFENGKGAIAQGLTNGLAFGTTEVYVLRAGPLVDPRYLFYSTISHSFRKLGEAEMYGAGGQKRIPESYVINTGQQIPPLAEQRAIAAFLDRETAHIDALIAKKERLIELLQEKRAAVITQAVTKGLDPSVPMKETGVSRFPQVPLDWMMSKLRHLIVQVKRPIEVLSETEYTEIGIRSWGKGIFHKEPIRGALLEDKAVYKIEPGDFVLNIVFAWEGAVAVAADSESGMIGSHRFPTFRCSDKIDARFLFLLLQTDPGRELMEVNSPGAAGRNKTIRLGQFLDEEIALPPLLLQQEIAQYIRQVTVQTDELAGRLEKALNILREYRTALISAAVAGRIDVRHEEALA
jgi:type I restriction enzyme S subunit